MISLKSKLQYNFYEIGEFTSDKFRNCEETTDLIRNYPWNEQRNGTFLSVGLTGASVTIEGKNDQYLKVGLYHYGWFIVYWVNEKGNVFLKVEESLVDVISITRQFFEEKLIKEDFKTYGEWVYKPLKHFKTKAFEYKTTLQRSILLVGLFVIVFVFLLITMIPLIVISSYNVIAIGICVGILFLFSGLPIILFLNYYHFSKRLCIKISRCNDEFEFGRIGSLKKYNKKEIRRIKQFSCNKEYRNRSPVWSAYCVFVIEMKNGEFLKFTSLMFSRFIFAYKLPEQKIKEEYLFFPNVQQAKFDPLILS